MQKVNLAVRIAKKSFLEKKILNPHVLILGDNQKVLKDIKDTYEHQVSLIYIDPPYNRGDDFKFYKEKECCIIKVSDNHERKVKKKYQRIIALCGNICSRPFDTYLYCNSHKSKWKFYVQYFRWLRIYDFK